MPEKKVFVKISDFLERYVYVAGKKEKKKKQKRCQNLTVKHNGLVNVNSNVNYNN